jgi:hypothetical protein
MDRKAGFSHVGDEAYDHSVVPSGAFLDGVGDSL